MPALACHEIGCLRVLKEVFDNRPALAYKQAMKCPHCRGEINPAAMMGSIKSEAKTAAALINGSKRKGFVAGKAPLPMPKCCLGYCLKQSSVGLTIKGELKFYCADHNPKAVLADDQ